MSVWCLDAGGRKSFCLQSTLFQIFGHSWQFCVLLVFQLRSRKEACDAKATAARNDYLLAMASSNAHQIRFYSTDLPDLMKVSHWWTTLVCSCPFFRFLHRSVSLPSAGWLADRPAFFLSGQLSVWSADWLSGWLAGWLTDWLTDQLFFSFSVWWSD